MEARIKNIRITSKKMNLVAGLVRKENVETALVRLKHTPKKAAEILYKALHSAASNAEHNEKKDIANLFIDEIIVNEGATMKRGLPVSRGRWHRILKRTCHVWIKLNEVK